MTKQARRAKGLYVASKRFKTEEAKVEQREYDATEALALVRDTSSTKFDSTIDLAVKLGVDPRQGDQVVRGTTDLPNGTGKNQRVAVFARGANAEAATAAGADEVGAEELVTKIQNGWREFDGMKQGYDCRRYGLRTRCEPAPRPRASRLACRAMGGRRRRGLSHDRVGKLRPGDCLLPRWSPVP